MDRALAPHRSWNAERLLDSLLSPQRAVRVIEGVAKSGALASALRRTKSTGPVDWVATSSTSVTQRR